MKRKSAKEILHQQLELLAEESKDTYPASDELSQNSFAMAKISNELLKRETLTAVNLIALGYLIVRLVVHCK